MESVEKVAETIEAAIDAGLRELGVTAADVMIEVLEEPSRGLFGIGARPAKVRIIFMGRRPEPEIPVTPAPAPAPRTDRPPRSDRPREGERPPRADRPAATASVDTSNTTDTKPRSDRNRNRNDRRPRRDDRGSGGGGNDYDVAFEDGEDMELTPRAVIIPDDQADEVALAGKQLLEELLEKMDIYGTITIHKSESSREGEESLWILNISGSDVAPLIGRKGEVLSSMQYLVRLMLSKRLDKRTNVIVDVGEHKLRRTDRLRQMATRMADQAVKQGRTVTLEPMPPNERRIVHMTLKERTDVETKSIGEGTARKVTINPITQ